MPIIAVKDMYFLEIWVCFIFFSSLRKHIAGYNICLLLLVRSIKYLESIT